MFFLQRGEVYLIPLSEAQYGTTLVSIFFFYFFFVLVLYIFFFLCFLCCKKFLLIIFMLTRPGWSFVTGLRLGCLGSELCVAWEFYFYDIYVFDILVFYTRALCFFTYGFMPLSMGIDPFWSCCSLLVFITMLVFITIALCF